MKKKRTEARAAPLACAATVLLLACQDPECRAGGASGMASVTQGMTRAEVVAVLGKPLGGGRMGAKDILLFGEGEVGFSGDRVVSVRLAAPPVAGRVSVPEQAGGKPPPGGSSCGPGLPGGSGAAADALPVTVAHEILKLEARFGAGRQDEIALGRLLQKARRSLPAAQGATDGQEARKRLAAIQEFLKQEGFRYHSTSFLYEALRTSNSDCDTSTLIYCAIGEVMGYPLGAVALPRHAFVRWSLPHGSVINWETTETNRNASFSDGSYYDWLLKGMTGEGCNLRTLTRQQLPAIHHYMAGLAFASMRRYDEALEEHDMALKIEPGWYISRLEKSSVHLLRESYAGGAVEALKAMEYLPADELGQLSAAAIALAVIAKQDAAVDRSQLGRVVRGFMRPDSDSAGYVVLTALDSFLDDRGSSAMADLHGACAKWPTNFVPFLCRAALKGRGGDAVGARKDSEEAVRLMRAGGVTRNVRALQSPARREERQP